MPKKIILDTNILLYVGKHNIDIFSELERICNFSYKVCVVEGTITELEKLINKSTLPLKRLAKLALTLIKAKKIEIIKTKDGKSVDDTLAALPAEGIIIATQDRELMARLKEKGIKVLSLRQKKMLHEG